ncbi:uncharacterized protein RCC_05451 [Ramularia collo-cygni]|uniref:LysM domain-containing protein n=1 Tax=Ramularia collo-cygni TaxID=112498 RepID=A0A2D3V2A4_9PEZI|nr:uncharacterized protein RCC_05451 [Ramularia collo-cygni]CZT19600.1 uncharacterized protein RCC_05451 [Ramularia collo-cygni]
MTSSNVRTSSAHSTASTLRPRTNRLISGLSDVDDTLSPSAYNLGSSNSSQNAARSPSPYRSRPVSPIPPAHPQRTGSQRNNGYLSAPPVRNAAGRQRKTGADSTSSLAGLWGNSWTALQGIASDLLGSNLAAADSNNKPRARTSASKPHNSRSASAGITPSQWGPSAPTSPPRAKDIGTGTREEQTAAFRAQKRKDMLTRQESSYADTLGKFKRRLSDDRNSVSAPPGGEEDRDALVYIHHVKKDDTLAGITIRYNIAANSLRKANRMWPNDAVQARQTLILPVDACGVKGKLASEADWPGSESDALSSLQAEEVPTPTADTFVNLPVSSKHGRTRTNSTSTYTTSSAAASSADMEPPWQHDSWVILPGNSQPTQIARLPRRALGYFPPARRKSNNWSDLDTPSSSLDLARTGTHDNSNPTSSPQRPRHTRRTSNATTGYFPSYLTGPGGVGTMSRNVRCPGPAQDGLNKMFAKHLPDVAPPRNQNALYQPELPLYTDHPQSLTSGSQTPAYPHSSSGSSMNLENVGGAIESWVRRLATKTASSTDRQHVARASVGTPGKGAGGIGDLIEMTDEFEIGGDDDDELGRGRQGSIPDGGMYGTSGTSYSDGGAVRERGKGAKKD